MAFITADRPIPRSSGVSALVRAGRAVADFLGAVGAAVRVAHAVESRRDASPDDLAILGISRPLPRRL
jgi:hypothetical protein